MRKTPSQLKGCEKGVNLKTDLILDLLICPLFPLLFRPYPSGKNAFVPAHLQCFVEENIVLLFHVKFFQSKTSLLPSRLTLLLKIKIHVLFHPELFLRIGILVAVFVEFPLKVKIAVVFHLKFHLVIKLLVLFLLYLQVIYLLNFFPLYT